MEAGRSPAPGLTLDEAARLGDTKPPLPLGNRSEQLVPGTFSRTQLCVGFPLGSEQDAIEE